MREAARANKTPNPMKKETKPHEKEKKRRKKAKKKQNMHPLFYHPRVFYSPHVAALTDISQKKIANLLANKVKKYLTKDKM